MYQRRLLVIDFVKTLGLAASIAILCLSEFHVNGQEGPGDELGYLSEKIDLFGTVGNLDSRILNINSEFEMLPDLASLDPANILSLASGTDTTIRRIQEADANATDSGELIMEESVDAINASFLRSTDSSTKPIPIESNINLTAMTNNSEAIKSDTNKDAVSTPNPTIRDPIAFPVDGITTQNGVNYASKLVDNAAESEVLQATKVPFGTPATGIPHTAEAVDSIYNKSDSIGSMEAPVTFPIQATQVPIDNNSNMTPLAPIVDDLPSQIGQDQTVNNGIYDSAAVWSHGIPMPSDYQWPVFPPGNRAVESTEEEKSTEEPAWSDFDDPLEGMQRRPDFCPRYIAGMRLMTKDQCVRCFVPGALRTQCLLVAQPAGSTSGGFSPAECVETGRSAYDNYCYRFCAPRTALLIARPRRLTPVECRKTCVQTALELCGTPCRNYPGCVPSAQQCMTDIASEC